jgi:hypothetical protein
MIIKDILPDIEDRHPNHKYLIGADFYDGFGAAVVYNKTTKLFHYTSKTIKIDNESFDDLVRNLSKYFNADVVTNSK